MLGGGVMPTREYVYRRVEELGRLGSFQVNMQTGKQEWSDQIFHLLGLQPGDIPPTYDSFVKFVHPDDRERLDALSQQTYAGEENLEICYRIIRSDGEERYLHTRAEVECAEDGTPVWILGFTQDVTERKQAEEAVATAADEWRTTFDSTQDAIMLLDTDHRVLRANRAAAEFTGVPIDALVGSKCHKVAHDLDAPPDFCPFAKVKKTKQRVQLETRLANGGRWVAITMDPVLDQAGTVIRAVHVASDISERKNAEEALRTSEAKFRIVAEQSPEMIFINKMGRVVFANSRCQEVTGYSTDEHLSDNFDFRMLFPPENLETVEASFKAHKEGKEVSPYECTLIAKDGNRVPVIISTKLIDYQGDRAILGIVTDVTEQKRAEAIVSAQRDLATALSSTTGLDQGLRLLIEAALCISGMDCGGVYLVDDTSGSVDLLFHQGLSEDFVNGVSHFDRESDHARLIMAGEPLYAAYDKVPVQLTEPEIRENLAALAVLPVKHDGRVIGCLNVASHALPEVPAFARAALEAIAAQIGSSLARLRAEEQLRKQENELARLAQISMMGEMAGEMAHELNQPLYAITNYATGVALRLKDSVADPGQFTEVLEKITGQARRASDIIRRLSNAVRNRKPCRSTTYLNDVLREVLKLVQHELHQDNIVVDLDLLEPLPAVFVDVIQIQQVVLYLIRNAREAMQDVPVDQRQLTLTTTTADDETIVQVGVGDTGRGLDTEAGDGIYYPFVSTKPQGLGMGLAISRTIIEAHEGRIWATPNAPCGTVFRFVIPTTVEQGSNRAD